jgi:hypothetical protein
MRFSQQERRAIIRLCEERHGKSWFRLHKQERIQAAARELFPDKLQLILDINAARAIDDESKRPPRSKETARALEDFRRSDLTMADAMRLLERHKHVLHECLNVDKPDFVPEHECIVCQEVLDGSAFLLCEIPDCLQSCCPRHWKQHKSDCDCEGTSPEKQTRRNVFLSGPLRRCPQETPHNKRLVKDARRAFVQQILSRFS